MKRFLFLIGCMMVLTSCGRSKKSSSIKKNRVTIKKTDRYIAKKIEKKRSPLFDLIRLQEAKMSDLPIPISSKPIPEYFDPTSSVTMLGYKDKDLSAGDIKTFYICEMERLGWEIKEQFDGYESQLRFKKPNRTCMISIRTDEPKKRTKFVISMGSKETIAA